LIDFTNIEYLKEGNHRQKKAYNELSKLGVFNDLKLYDPILTGTIPIEIDIPESDLDIICHCSNHKKFQDNLNKLYTNKNDFLLYTTNCDGLLSTVAKFSTPQFKIEIFGQNQPTKKQSAYRHMLIEHKILNEKGNEFRKRIINLKLEGTKTEPAFAQLLGLEGNPYLELLNVKF